MKQDKNRQSPQRLHRRMSACIVFLIAFCLLIVGRLFWLQVIQGADLTRRADNQTEMDRELQSPRGSILDRNGKVLAISEMAKSLYADPTMIKRTPAEVAKILAPYLRINEAEITERLSRDTAFVWLDRTMDADKYEALKAVIDKEKLQGLRFVDENHRYYPNGSLAAQLIGFVGTEDKGLSGIEMVLDDEIRGGVQQLRITTDRNAVPIFDSALEKVLPDKERTARLTIDETLQFAVEQNLDTIMTRHKPTGAAIIIMDPKTGEILAMGSRPTFNLNEYGKGNVEQYKNRAVINLYEPGSTFKPIVAASALDAGKWRLDQVYHDQGFIDVDDRTIHNWDNEGNGNVTLKEILKFSINTGMAKIAMTAGADTLITYAKRFGFGEPTGIELPGEGEGILFNAKDMTPINEATMGIGQSIAVTPLQMVQAFGAIANKGHMMKPFVVKEIDNPDGTIYKKTEPQEVGQPVSEATATAISQILAEEVSSGGGQNAHIAGYRFGGKTGTAQRLNVAGTGYAEGQYISSFIGFGPIENPQYVVLIVVDNPSGIYYGAQVAAPIFKELMTDIIRFKGIPPSQSVEGTPKSFQAVGPTKPTYTIPPVERTAQGVRLPSFMGWDSREVNDWLNSANLGFVPHGTGRAISQSPVAGSYALPGSDVTVTFSR